MANRIPNEATTRRRGSTSGTPVRRRAVKKAPTQAIEGLVPVEKITPEDTTEEMREARRMGRRTLKPLKEAYFVGVGLLDWAVEQFWTAEKRLAARGQKRNEVLGQVVSDVSANVTSGAKSAYRGTRERISSLGEKLGDKVCEGVSKMPAKRRRAARQMPEEESVPMAQPI